MALKPSDSQASEKIKRKQALQAIPARHRLVTEARLDSGEVVIAYPVAVRPWMAKVLKLLRREPEGLMTRKLQLDVLGTAVWDLIDGQRTVHHVIERFANLYQLQTREAEISVTQFLRELGRRGVIGMR